MDDSALLRRAAAGDDEAFAVSGLGSRDGRTYCPGHHTLRVGYSMGSGPFAGRLVGSYAFTVTGVMSDDELGWAVLRAAVARVCDALGDRLAAAYAVGSLTHGGFAADVSDVDGVLIVDHCDDGAAAAIEAVVEDVRAQGGLAERLSLFWGDWATFGTPPAAARLPPIVRLDLLDDGVAVYGGDPPDGLPRPTDGDLVRESAAFAAQWLERDGIPAPDVLLADGRRRTTKMVLFPVRFLATVCAGLSGSNDEAVAWYVGEQRPHARLAAAALRWRTEEIDAPELLDALPALYAEALTALRAHPAIGDDVRARLAALLAA